MIDNKTGKKKEYRKSFKNYDMVIDKSTIITVIVCVAVIISAMIGIFYLADVL